MLSCAVALVLLLDASGSISPADWETQIEGHALALEAPEITREPIAVSIIAFSQETTPLLEWRILRTPQDAAQAAADLRQSERPFAGGTNLGEALQEGLTALEDVPCDPESRVIDMVTDGIASERSANRARDEAISREVRINALGVGPPEAAAWLRENVITPGGFSVQAETWAQFTDVIRRKITLEIAQKRLETVSRFAYASPIHQRALE